MKRFLAAVVVLALIALLPGCQPGGTGLPARLQQVSVGFAGPLTGQDAALGQDMKNAAQLAVEEVNASEEARGAGIAFVLVAKDDGDSTSQAASVAASLAADPKVAAVLGHPNAGCSLIAASAYNDAGMAMVSMTSDSALTAQGFTVVNQIVTRDAAEGGVAADFAKSQMELTKVVVVDDSTTYGEGLAGTFTREFAGGGGTVLASKKVAPRQTDFKALVAAIKPLAPQAVYYAGTEAEGAHLAKQVKDSGLKVVFIGGDTMHANDYVEVVGPKNAEGDACTELALPIDQQPGSGAFLAAYRQRYGTEPAGLDSYAYDAAKVIMQAALQVGSGDRAKVAAAVRAISYDGATGRTTFDSKGDTRNVVVPVYRIQNGLWAQVQK